MNIQTESSDCYYIALKTISVVLAASHIISEIFQIFSDGLIYPWNYCIICLNILWIYGICMNHSTLMLPLLIFEGIITIIIVFYCLPLWVMSKIQQSRNFHEEEYLDKIIIPLIINVTTVILKVFAWVIEYFAYKDTFRYKTDQKCYNNIIKPKG